MQVAIHAQAQLRHHARLYARVFFPMSILLFAHLLLAASLLLALGFHRHRAAQVAVVLWLLLAGVTDVSLRVQTGALHFLPWLLPLCVAMPEARLLSRRHAVFVGVIAALVGIVLRAPSHVFEPLRDLAAAPLFGLMPASGAALLILLAAILAGVRWFRQRQPMDAGLAFALLPAAIGCVQHHNATAWFAASGMFMLMAILHASYRMAFIDPLTGLPNRRALDETLARLSGQYALAMIDIDHFKSFNDTHGHAAGDVVLHEVANSLHRHAQGRAFRYGGEEFCIVFRATRHKSAQAALERARERIEAMKVRVKSAKKPASKKNPNTAREVDVIVTISAGCASRNETLRTPEAVLKAADAALYKAKAKGRNRVVMV